MKNTGVCVLGMHRSGTSCLVGSLQAAGVQLGEVVEFAPHNRKGNREHLGIRELNDAVLTTSGGAWNLPPHELRWTAEQAARRDAIVHQLASLPGRCWGFKDPRSVLTMPFWHEAVPDLRMVATFRHPHAVAHSLAARDGMSLDDGLRLWMAYNEIVLSWLARRGGPLVSFDVSREEYLEAVGHAIRWLGLDEHPAAEGRQAVFFDDELRHQSVADASCQQPLPPEIDRVYRHLEDYYRTCRHERPTAG